MPKLDENARKKVEALAKIIFPNGRTLVNINNFAAYDKFKDVKQLFKDVWGYDENDCYKVVYSIFSLYVTENKDFNNELKNAIGECVGKDISLFKLKARGLEHTMHCMAKKPSDIGWYITDMVAIEKLHESILHHEISELDHIIGIQNLPKIIKELESKKNLLNEELNEAKLFFGDLGSSQFDVNYCTYLNNLKISLERVINCISRESDRLDKALHKYVDGFETNTRKALRENSYNPEETSRLIGACKKRLLYENNHYELLSGHIIFKVLNAYVDICKLVYNTDISTIGNVGKYAFEIFDLLGYVLGNCEREIQEMLKIAEIYKKVARILFEPVATVRSGSIPCLQYLYDNKSLKMRAPYSKCLWRSIDPDSSIEKLHEIIDILTIVELYLSNDEIPGEVWSCYVLPDHSPSNNAYQNLVSLMLKVHKQYILLLNDDDLQKYYDLAAIQLGCRSTLVLNHKGRLVSGNKDAHKFQEYHGNLMEYLVSVMEYRFGATWNHSYKKVLKNDLEIEDSMRRFPTLTF